MNCKGCEADPKYKGSPGCVGAINLGHLVETTGYTPIFTHGGNCFYLCPKCFAKANKLAKKILEITKDDDLYFPSLLKKGD